MLPMARPWLDDVGCDGLELIALLTAVTVLRLVRGGGMSVYATPISSDPVRRDVNEGA